VGGEGHAAPFPLDTRQLAELHPLESGEAAAAIGADAAAPDRRMIFARTRILHLRVRAAAIRASHGRDPPLLSPHAELSIDRIALAEFDGTLLHARFHGGLSFIAPCREGV